MLHSHFEVRVHHAVAASHVDRTTWVKCSEHPIDTRFVSRAIALFLNLIDAAAIIAQLHVVGVGSMSHVVAGTHTVVRHVLKLLLVV